MVSRLKKTVFFCDFFQDVKMVFEPRISNEQTNFFVRNAHTKNHVLLYEHVGTTLIRRRKFAFYGFVLKIVFHVQKE